MQLIDAVELVMADPTLDSNERSVLYHVLANSNTLHRCHLRPAELGKLAQLPKSSLFRSLSSLQSKGRLLEHHDPRYYVAWPYSYEIMSQGGGSRLWIERTQVQRIRALCDTEIAKLTLMAQDAQDRRRIEDRRKSLLDLDELTDIVEILDRYLERTAKKPLLAEK